MVQILLVDAAEAEAEALGAALRSGSTGDNPIEVTTVADPREAVAFASQKGCDVVVAELDLPRPGWSGPYVVRRVRELCPRVRSFLIADTDAWAPFVRGAADGLIARQPQGDPSGSSLADRLMLALQSCKGEPEADSDTWRRSADGAAEAALERAVDVSTAEAPRPVKANLRGSGIGTLIAGKYRLLSELGHGGMGIVYRATDTFIGRQVAVKLMKFPAFLSSDPVRDRMRREVMITGRLAHPNLVTVYDAGIDHGEMYIVLELIEGASLKELLFERPRLPPDEALGIAGQILDALEHTHGQGIVHRDLKPGNILVTREGRPKVVDFGIAKLVSLATAAGSPADSGSGSATTSAGAILGTPAYMAPEQLMGEEIDARTDLYALGAVLFEMLWGASLSSLHSPFSRAPRGPLPQLPGDPRLTGLVDKALAAAPAARFASAAAMKAALAELGRPAPPPKRSWWQLGGRK
jgi:CheY-like chemotaxis protein